MTKRILTVDLILGAIITLMFMAFSYKGLLPFEVLERYVYDVEMRFGRPERQGPNKIVLIDIDDKSFSQLGSWPWPRDLFAQMINILTKNGAKVIGLYLPFNEKEPNKSVTELGLFAQKLKAYPFGQEDPILAAWILENLKQMESNLDNDTKLVGSVQECGNVVLPVFAQLGSDHDRTIGRIEPFLFKQFLTSFRAGASLKEIPAASYLSLPYPELAQNVLGLGHANLVLDDMMAGRSHALFITYRGSLLPSFPLRLAIAHFNQQPRQVLVEDDQIRVQDKLIPTIKGRMFVKFQNGKGVFPHYSFGDILQAKKIPPGLKGKIVVIGFNSRESRRVNTSISEDMPEGEYIAHVLDDIINSRFIVRLPFMSYVEILGIFLLGGFAAYFFPQMRQLKRLGWMLGLSFFVLLAELGLFHTVDVWFKATYISGCIVAVYLAVSARRLFAAESIARESLETHKLLGLTFQSQGFLDLAFEKFQRLPLNDSTKALLYDLGLDYEKRRMVDKALSVYEYINRGGGFRTLDEHIRRLREADQSSTIGSHAKTDEVSLLENALPGEKPRIGRYEILGELGKGSMGLVYKALDPNINRLLAIKTIRFSDEFDEEVIQEIKERFFREAQIAGKLSHPSIVTIYDVGEDGDLTYMAMEFLEGEDLEKFVSKNNLLPFRRILDVLAKVADAVGFAHQAGVIHRDIKPANIMVLSNGGVKVTDFGIAKAMSSTRTRTGVILGTPNYMSPEQIMGQKIDVRSDLFSLGVLFFQLLTGELPFHGENLSSLLYQITKERHPSVRDYDPNIPKVCEQIIDRALAKDPNERFPTAGEMARVIRLVAARLDQIKEKGPAKGAPVTRA